MVAINRTVTVPGARNEGSPRSDYVPQWPTAKGRPYQGRVPYLAKRTWTAMRCAYSLPNTHVTFTRKIGGVTATFANLVKVVADVFEIDANDLLSQRRAREYARPRQALCALLKEYTRKSLPDIGRLMNRDHTTVMHAIRRVPDICKKDYEFAEKLQICRYRIVAPISVEGRK